MDYYNDQNPRHRFAPREERRNGPEYEDGCRNCGHRFCDHYNGSCPKDDEEGA